LEDEINECSDDHAPTDNEYGNMMTDDWPDDDDLTDELMDKYVNAELIFDDGFGNEKRGCVTKGAKGAYGETVGLAHANPLFDTRQ
jgi:hypothetical protein